MQAQAKSLLVGIVLTPILVSIAQSGPLACTITFTKPWAPFPYYLAGGIGGQIAYVVAPSMLANKNGTMQPVGTGPFIFKEWIPNDHFTATANPHYWRPGLPYLDEITFKPIVDAEGRAEALKSGTIDMMITDTPQIIKEFRGNSAYAYTDDSSKIYGQPDMNFIQLNCLAKPFNDPNVRRAAAMAINRPQYAKVIDQNALKLSNGVFAPGSPYYSKTSYSRSTTRPRPRSCCRPRPRPPVGRSRSPSGAPPDRPPSGPRSTSSRRSRMWASRSPSRPSSRTTSSTSRWLGQVPGARVAPVRCGRPRPQLHLLEHDHGQHRPSLHQLGPQQPTPRSRPPCRPAGSSTDPGGAGQGVQDGEPALCSRPPVHLFTDRAVWAVVSQAQGAELEQPDDSRRQCRPSASSAAPSGPPRSG